MSLSQQLKDAGRPQRPDGEPEAFAYAGPGYTRDKLSVIWGDISVCPKGDTLYPMHDWEPTDYETEEGNPICQCSQCEQYATEPDEDQWMVYECACGVWYREDYGEDLGDCYKCRKAEEGK